MKIDPSLKPADLLPQATRVLELACKKVRAIDRAWDASKGTPVFTVKGRYTTRGWTEWTQGFQYGSALLCFDGTGDRELLELGRSRTLERMAPHVTHMGVHDHGFNNISTYGNLRRLMREGRIERNEWEMRFYEMALKASGAVQAARCSKGRNIQDFDGEYYIYSFNGPHSLFVDTMRTLRVLALAHQLGHVLMGERDQRTSLLNCVTQHMAMTKNYLICYGNSGEHYDIRGRTAHEAIFNRNDGWFRCRSTQQGYSPFSTWTRGLAWAILGFAEQLEFLRHLDHTQYLQESKMSDASRRDFKGMIQTAFRDPATATADHYINDVTAADGIPYWDDGAPGLAKLGDWRGRLAEPLNDYEPVDSSAAAIAAQGLIRLGMYLGAGAPSRKGGAYAPKQRKVAAQSHDSRKLAVQAPPTGGRDGAPGARYLAAGLTVARTLFAEPYLSTSDKHQGLILHSVYHRPNGWDHIPRGRKVPCGESSMWGDYHAIELAVLIQRLAKGQYMTFFDR